jgi:hypothetical protein
MGNLVDRHGPGGRGLPMLGAVALYGLIIDHNSYTKLLVVDRGHPGTIIGIQDAIQHG